MSQDGDKERLARAIRDSMAYAANETRILAGFEEFFSPRPARLWDSDEKEKTFVLRIDRITKRLGGPPKYILEVQNEPQTVYDTYAIAAFKEVISVFYAARKFVCRAHMLQIGTDALRRFPEAVNTENEEIRRMFQSNAEDAFWEHAENAFIKLCSYWDRVGQILDFIFSKYGSLIGMDSPLSWIESAQTSFRSMRTSKTP